MLDHPADLLATVGAARAAGWRIAVDDLGTNSDSLALLPLMAPEIVKLDLNLIQGPVTPNMGRTMTAGDDYVERTGASIVAEGIESDAHLARARAFGATLGQGFRFGKPDDSLRRCAGLGMPAPPHGSGFPASPFSAVAESPRVRIATKDVLYAISLDIEQLASRLSDSPMLVASFQDVGHIGAPTIDRCRSLVDNTSLTVVAARGLSEPMIPGARHVDLRADDPAANEWNVIVLSPHASAALIANDLGDDGPDGARRFAYVLTHDRDTVPSAATSMLHRIAS